MENDSSRNNFTLSLCLHSAEDMHVEQATWNVNAFIYSKSMNVVDESYTKHKTKSEKKKMENKNNRKKSEHLITRMNQSLIISFSLVRRSAAKRLRLRLRCKIS